MGPKFFHLNLQNFSFYFIMAVIGLGLNEATCMAGIIRAGIKFGARGPDRSVDRAGHVVVDDDAAHHTSATSKQLEALAQAQRAVGEHP